MWIIISLIAVVTALAVGYVKNLYSYWARRGVPHEKPSFPLGNGQGLGKTIHFRDMNARIYKRFKGQAPFAGVYFLTTRSAMLLDLELIRHVMIKDFSNFRDRGVFHNVEDEPLSGHLFSLEGDPWHALRVKLSPVFTSGKMKFMFPTVINVSDNLVNTCAQLVANEKSAVIDLKELCARFTTDVIGTCAFGLECNSLKDPNAEFRTKGRSIFDKPRHMPLVQAFMFTNPDMARKLHMKFWPDDVTDFFMNAVRTTVEYRIKNKIKRNDFMDMLIDMMAEDQAAARKGDGIDLSHGLTLEQMAAQAFVFFVAGFDTSSTTMSFCLYELALNADVQEKLREEIVRIIGEHDGKLSYEAINDMKYLDQVVAETLRKHSVLPHLVRKTIRDYKVPNTNQIIEAGTPVVIPIEAIQMDEEYYPEPEKFDPSRFEPENVAKRHPMAYLPFGDGPRNCIGMRFGKMQTKIGLIQLLRNFKFAKSERTEVPLTLDKRTFILTTKHGIWLHVEKL